MTLRAVHTPVRARLRLLEGPLVRVAAWSGGGVAIVATVLLVLAFHSRWSSWGSAVAAAVAVGMLLALVATGGFLASAPRCPRCRRWREVLTGAGGQDLCSGCWREITGD